jgi:hypothetical protein
MKTLEFKNHPIHQKILELKSRCNDSKTKEKVDADLLLIIKTFYQFLNDRLGLAIHALVNTDELNAIQNELQSTLTHLTEYLTDNNTGRLQAVQQNINNSMPFVRNIPIILNKAEFNFSEINANYSDFIETKIAAINESIAQLNKDIDVSHTQFLGQNNIIDSLKTQLADQQNQTNEIANDFRNYLQGIQQEFEQRGILISNAQKQHFEDTKNEFATRVDLLIDEIMEKRDKARQMLNVIGQEGTAIYFGNGHPHPQQANATESETVPIDMIERIIKLIRLQP